MLNAAVSNKWVPADAQFEANRHSSIRFKIVFTYDTGEEIAVPNGISIRHPSGCTGCTSFHVQVSIMASLAIFAVSIKYLNTFRPWHGSCVNLEWISRLNSEDRIILKWVHECLLCLIIHINLKRSRIASDSIPFYMIRWIHAIFDSLVVCVCVRSLILDDKNSFNFSCFIGPICLFYS